MVRLQVDLRACFTKYTVTPGRGLNFGPQVYNTTSLPRSFEIANNGEFPFQVIVAPYGAEVEYAIAEPEDPKDAKAKDAAKPKAATPPKKGKGEPEVAGLTLGNFSVNPPLATVEPGQSVTVRFLGFLGL
jgi:hydrocephalus-inducing protein